MKLWKLMTITRLKLPGEQMSMFQKWKHVTYKSILKVYVNFQLLILISTHPSWNLTWHLDNLTITHLTVKVSNPDASGVASTEQYERQIVQMRSTF